MKNYILKFPNIKFNFAYQIFSFTFLLFTSCTVSENKIWIKPNEIQIHDASGVSVEIKIMDIFDFTRSLAVSNEIIGKIKDTGIGEVPSVIFSFEGIHSQEYRIWKSKKITFYTPQKKFTITVLEIKHSKNKIEEVHLQID